MNERSDAGQLVISRRFTAPRSLVFEAWTRPQHLLAWFCPDGYRVEQAEADVRVGGRWRSQIRSPDGRKLVERGIYCEVTEPDRLVFTHTWESATGEPTKETIVSVTFVENAGVTEMTFKQVGLPSVQLLGTHGEGWRQAFETLGEHLDEWRGRLG